MTTRPLTIGLPVYNAERYLEEAVESILGQTFADFTLVVSDNASTDRTIEILESYAARDERVVILRSDTNRGAAWNFNRVFAGCTTPYFKWAAADDMLAPTCVERCLDVLSAAPRSIVLVFPRTRVIDENGRPIGELSDPLATRPDAPVHERLRQVVANIVKGNAVFAVMRTEALQRTRLHGNYPSSDLVLLAELALAGSFAEVPEPLFFRRDHPAMSRRANPSLSELSLWFDPAAAPVRHESARLLREHIAAVAHAELSPAERARVLVTLLDAWARRRWRPRVLVRWARRKARLRTRARRLIASRRP